MLAILGKITNALIGWALPGLSASALYVVAGLLAIGVPSAYAWHKASVGSAAALAAEKASCEVRLARKEAALQHVLRDILENTNKDDTPEPETAAAEAELCKHSAFCVEGDK